MRRRPSRRLNTTPAPAVGFVDTAPAPSAKTRCLRCGETVVVRDAVNVRNPDREGPNWICRACMSADALNKFSQ